MPVQKKDLQTQRARLTQKIRLGCARPREGNRGGFDQLPSDAQDKFDQSCSDPHPRQSAKDVLVCPRLTAQDRTSDSPVFQTDVAESNV